MSIERLPFLLWAALIASTPIALAHHGEHHHEPPVIPHIEHQAPLPEPLPEPSATQSLPQFQAPLLPAHSLVPTDVSSLGGSLGRAQGLGQKFRRFAPRDAGARRWQIVQDPRYEFSGAWIPFWSDADEDSRALSQRDTDHDGAFRDTMTRQQGRVEQVVVLPEAIKSKQPMFMATSTARYLRDGKNELLLSEGALLVRASSKPVFVAMHVQGKRITARFSGCTISMVSLLDGRAIILNLTEKCCGACSMLIPVAGRTQPMTIGPGQIAEVYPAGTAPTSHSVAAKIIAAQPLDDLLCLQIARHHYIAALKRYNISRSLPKPDVNRVLKTAAALAYVRGN